MIQWEQRAYRACILCKWGQDETPQESGDASHVSSALEGKAQVRMCVNPAVVGNRPGSRVPVTVARAPAAFEVHAEDLAPGLNQNGLFFYARGACGPDAKYLDFPGLTK